MLPLYSVGGPGKAMVLQLPWSTIARKTVSQILKHKKSRYTQYVTIIYFLRRLAMFLCANLTFMVMEVTWGLWTNSLGFIA